MVLIIEKRSENTQIIIIIQVTQEKRISHQPYFLAITTFLDKIAWLNGNFMLSWQHKG